MLTRFLWHLSLRLSLLLKTSSSIKGYLFSAWARYTAYGGLSFCILILLFLLSEFMTFLFLDFGPFLQFLGWIYWLYIRLILFFVPWTLSNSFFLNLKPKLFCCPRERERKTKQKSGLVVLFVHQVSFDLLWPTENGKPNSWMMEKPGQQMPQ